MSARAAPPSPPPVEVQGESRWRRLEAAVPFVFAGYALAASAAGRPLVVDIAISAAVLYQIGVAIWYRGKRRFRIQSVGGTLLTGAFAITLPSTRFSYVLVPAGFACLLVALGRVQTAAVLGRASHTLRNRRLLEEPDDAGRRDAASFTLVLPAIVVALLTLPLASWIVRQEKHFVEYMREKPPVITPDQDNWFQQRDRSKSNQPRPGTNGLTYSADPSTRPKPGTGRTDFNSDDRFLDRRVLMEITPTADGEPTGNLGPLYLRGIPLVDDKGEWIEDTSRATRVEDANDGRSDGWCDLSVRPRAADAVQFAIHQDAPIYGPDKAIEIVALCPPGTSSIEAKAVRGAPGGPLLVPVKSQTDSFDYKLVGRRPERVVYPGANTHFATGDPRGTKDLGRSPVWGDLKEMARVATVGAATDIEIAKAVTEHLRANFKYQRVNDPFLRNDELSTFMTRRGGTCLEFAKAGVVMLRTLGVPARVGRGLLVGAYDEEQKLYLGRACDGHAWIEVAFDGCGWVVFDPTPDAPDDWGWTRPDPEKLKAEGEDPEGDPSSNWLPSLDNAVGGARSGVQRVYDWIVEHWIICLALGGTAAWLIWRASKRRDERLAGERPTPTFRRSSWERLSYELARLGYRRRPPQTALEFAAAVAAAGGPVFEPYIDLAERQQAARFRGSKLTPDDEDAFDEFRRTIAQVHAEKPG